MSVTIFISIGVCAGILAGLFGVGGGLIIVPALVFIVGYNQTAATGTSLVALLAPVGLAGVYAFYQAGAINVTNVKAGFAIALGMFLGSFIGAKLALSFSDIILKRLFCIFLIGVIVRMWISTSQR